MSSGVLLKYSLLYLELFSLICDEPDELFHTEVFCYSSLYENNIFIGFT